MPFDPTAQTGDLCGDCEQGRFRLDRARSVFHFQDATREAIHAFKYKGKMRLAQPLGEMMAERFTEFYGDVAVDALLPVPLHKRRERLRGYNQAKLLSETISQRHDVQLRSDVLFRMRATRPQIELTQRQRVDNVRGAFHVNDPETVKDKAILLVDDMFTTGATLGECARTLRRAGATAVYGYTLARG